jgi:hypothetical protein
VKFWESLGVHEIPDRAVAAADKHRNWGGDHEKTEKRAEAPEMRESGAYFI